MSTVDPDADEHTFETETPTGVARCSALEGQSEPYTVNGVAIGADEVTFGQNGPKYWPSEELRRAAQSLVGVPLTKNHDDDRVESVVGEVIDAGFESGVGVVFEAEIDDEDLATKVARGRLEVSIHAIHTDGGHTDDGALIAENIRFLDLSLVPRGGSPSNRIEAGASPSEALASVSADDVADYLDREGPRPSCNRASPDDANSTMTEDTDEPTEEAEASEQIEADESDDVAEAEASEDVESEPEAEEAEAGEDVESEPDAEEAEVEGDGTTGDVEESELREEVVALREENDELQAELRDVRMTYAEELAEGTPFEAEELAEKYSFNTLAAKFEESDASLVEDSSDPSEATPAPRTGADEDAELSTANEADDSEIAELESKIENYEQLGWDAAKADAEERLEALRS